ncbi:MAG: hypothetical protein RSI33_10700 [Clostridia bacterium]
MKKLFVALVGILLVCSLVITCGGALAASTQSADERAKQLPDDLEHQIVDVLNQCAEGTTDKWQLAIYRAGVRDIQADPEKEGVYTFTLRGFNPALKELGKYQGENKKGYLGRLLENARTDSLEVSLTMEEGAFTAKSVKALQGVVKKTAAASQKAFKDKNVLKAFVDELFYTGYGAKIKKANELLDHSSEYLGWFSAHENDFHGLSAEKWAPFFCGQVKQTLDVSEGPYSIKLTCSAVNMAEILERAHVTALKALSYLEYDQRWKDGSIEKAFLQALADNVLTLRKKTKGLETTEITLSVDDSLLMEKSYPAYLGTYRYMNILNMLEYDVMALPKFASLEFPKAGWLSGVKKGTQVCIKAPKDSNAFYVILRDYESNMAVAAGFVRPNSTCSLRVPKGNYYCVLASGNSWYGEKELFGKGTALSKTGKFEVLGSNYRHTITLQVKPDGNLPIYDANEDEMR